MLRHVCAVSKKADTLWFKWVHTYLIKYHYFWFMDVPSDSSWTMKKLFKLGSLGQKCIQYTVRNGEKTFLWLDNWHPMGPLCKYFCTILS